MYNCHSKRGNRGYWRCHNYSKKQAEQRCRARCVIVNNSVQSMTGGPHNHQPHKEKIDKFMRRSEIIDELPKDEELIEISECKTETVNLDDFINEHEDEDTLILEGVL